MLDKIKQNEKFIVDNFFEDFWIEKGKEKTRKGISINSEKMHLELYEDGTYTIREKEILDK